MDAKAVLLMLPALALVGAANDPTTAFKAGNFDSARAGYAQAVRERPGDADALVGLATTELYDNDLVDARRDAGRALALAPSNERARRLQQTIAMRIGTNGTFVVQQRGDAVLPFVRSQPLPVVRVQIDGADAEVALDTGAGSLAVSPAFARKHHLALRTMGVGVFAGGKRAPILGTTIQSITAGPIAVRNIDAAVLPGPDQQLDGVIGTSFFSHFLTTVDYPRGRLILRPKTAAPPQDVVANERMWLVGDHFIFAYASIDGHAPMLFNVDSGADLGVQLTKATMDATGVTPANEAQRFAGGGGAARVFPLTANSVSVGGARQDHVSGVYFPDGDQYGIFPFSVAGTISGGFLSHYAVTYDFERMRFILSR